MPRTKPSAHGRLPDRAFRQLLEARVRLGRSYVDASSHHYWEVAERIRSRTDLLDGTLAEDPRYEAEFGAVAEAEAQRWHDPTGGVPCDDLVQPCLLCRAEAALNSMAA